MSKAISFLYFIENIWYLGHWKLVQILGLIDIWGHERSHKTIACNIVDFLDFELHLD